MIKAAKEAADRLHVDDFHEVAEPSERQIRKYSLEFISRLM